MKNLFLVNTEKGPRVITESVLATDLKEKVGQEVKVKRHYFDDFATGAVEANNGSAITEAEYNSMLTQYACAIITFASMTPYAFYQYMKNPTQLV